MPLSTGDTTTITPFADEAMRLLREKWPNPTMLSEEMFAILQRGIPMPRSAPININVSYGSLWPAMTLSSQGSGPLLKFKNANGETAQITQDFQFLQDENTPIAPSEKGGKITRITPRVVWADPGPISNGDALSGTQLNATATDPRTGSTITGTFVYDPPSGTTMSTGDDQVLSVVFTPDNQRTYKRGRGQVTIDVIGSGVTFLFGPLELNGSTPPFAVNEDDLLLVFAVSRHDASGVTISFSDNTANTYAQAGSYVSEDYADGGGTTYLRVSAWWTLCGTTTAGLEVNATPSDGAATVTYYAYRYEGTDLVSPIEATFSGTGHEITGVVDDVIDIVNVTMDLGSLVAIAEVGISMTLTGTSLNSDSFNNGSTDAYVTSIDVDGDLDEDVTDISWAALAVVVKHA